MSITTELRIKYALYHSNWRYGKDSRSVLMSTADKVLVSEYRTEMDGKLFCPGCFTNLTRTPKDKDLFSNGRRACFSHLPTYSEVPCDLRSKKPEGKKYLTEEEAREAIANRELAVISAFRAEAPESVDLRSGVYDQSLVENIAGPDADLAIGRHHGETFNVPTRIATVAAICRNFDENLYRFYIFPGSSIATRLVDALVDIASIHAVDDTPRLYFGRILSTRNVGINPKPTNLRMTWFAHHPDVKDFCLKDVDATQLSKGINDESVGRIVLLWGKVTESGIGLCVNRPSWGEYALLPIKYNKLLD